MMEKRRLFLLCCAFELMIIGLIAAANRFSGFLYVIFYHLLYGIAVSTLLPLLFLVKEKSSLAAVGFKRLGGRQIIVLSVFAAFSVGGQIIPKLIAGELLRWDVLPVAILPLVMTTFFEEFLFRGFLQTRLQKCFGTVAAILGSGLLFSLYHLGYPGFRTAGDSLLLFAVGIGFAFSFLLSGNNLIVSYFVNLPNAFVTYVLRHQQFPTMTAETATWAGIAIALTGMVILSPVRRRSVGACLHAQTDRHRTG